MVFTLVNPLQVAIVILVMLLSALLELINAQIEKRGKKMTAQLESLYK